MCLFENKVVSLQCNRKGHPSRLHRLNSQNSNYKIMFTVYNLICNNRADQVAIARNIAEQLTEAYNGTDLTAAVEAFAKLYQERKEMDFCNPTEWEGEEGNIYNAIEETPEEVWNWLETLYEDEMEYLNNIIEG